MKTQSLLHMIQNGKMPKTGCEQWQGKCDQVCVCPRTHLGEQEDVKAYDSY